MSTKKDAVDPFSPDEHFQHFSQFCLKVRAVGGATPHLSMVGQSAENLPVDDILWRGLCYAAVYNYAGAEVLWNSWTPDQILNNPGKFNGWVERVWPWLPLRKERKAVNNTFRFTECVLSAAEWANRFEWGRLPLKDKVSDAALYEQWWNDFTQIKFMGRYIAIRFLEYMRRYMIGCDRLVMPDLRAADAPYPRKSLSLMYPLFTAELNGGNSTLEINRTNWCAERLLYRLRTEAGLVTNYYTIQSLLCEYKQSVLGRRQYPGRSVDSEIKFFNSVYLPGDSPFKPLLEKTQFYQVRSKLFPQAALGEVQGWNDARNDLGRVLTDYGYTWSDVLYDYRRSRDDLSKPVMRMSAAPDKGGD